MVGEQGGGGNGKKEDRQCRGSRKQDPQAVGKRDK